MVKLARLALLAFSAAALSLPVAAEINKGAHLNTSGQGKVNKAMAKGYLSKGAEQMQQSQSQVNIGSKKAGTCTMNVGATESGKGSKETIVTAKEIINVCK